MGKVIFGMTMSLDGFISKVVSGEWGFDPTRLAGACRPLHPCKRNSPPQSGGVSLSYDRNGDVSRLYPDLAELRKTEMLQEMIKTTGAVVMGRRAYDMAEGDFTDYEFQAPIFVLTHHVPEKVAKGENERLSFTFVTDGIKSAIEKAKAAADDKYVTVIGGANTAQQLIQAGLVDEIQIGIVPILLGEGLRLFEHVDKQIELERIKVIESPTRTDIRFRVVK